MYETSDWGSFTLKASVTHPPTPPQAGAHLYTKIKKGENEIKGPLESVEKFLSRSNSLSSHLSLDTSFLHPQTVKTNIKMSIPLLPHKITDIIQRRCKHNPGETVCYTH